MTPETFTKEQFWAKLDTAGEKTVRVDLARGTYGVPNTDRHALVQEWLRQKDHNSFVAVRERIETSNAEQIRIARSAKNAAWIAAMAAITAAIVAVIAVILSLNP